MATQLLGGNRAYYTPSFFGSGNAAFDPSGGVGTAAIGEADALRSLISAMLQGFTPGPAGSGMGASMDTGGSDFTPPGGEVAAGGSGSIIQDRETLNSIAGLNQSLGMAAGIPGLESLGGISEALGSLSPVLSAALAGTADAERQERSEISQRAWEALGGGLDISPIDYGSTGVNPSGAALAAFVPGAAALAGVNPIIGGLIGQGIRTAADPVPPTNQDIIGRLVDAVVPGIVNAGIQLGTGSTLGQNIKGSLTPVETAVPVEDRSTYPGEAPAGKTPEQALAEMLAEGVNVNMLDAGIPQVSDTIEPMSTQLEASGSSQSVSVESPVGTVSDTDFFSANPEITTPTLAAIAEMMGPSMEELEAGRAAEETAQAAAPVDMSVPESSGASMEPSVVQSIFDAMVNYQQQTESSVGTPSDPPAGDYGFEEAASDAYGYEG